MFEQREIHRAIGELAYVIAIARNGLQLEEKKTFFEIIEKELNYNAWAAESRFEILDEQIHPTIDHAYNEAIHELRAHKAHLTPELKEITLNVVESVANTFQKTDIQDFIIDRLKNDLKSM